MRLNGNTGHLTISLQTSYYCFQIRRSAQLYALLVHPFHFDLLANGVDAPTVMEYSGHKSYQSFSVYLHKTDMGERRACLILEGVDHSLTTSGALKTDGTNQPTSYAPAPSLQSHRNAFPRQLIAWLVKLSGRCALRSVPSRERSRPARSLPCPGS